MAKTGRPPGKTYTKTVVMRVTDEQHAWLTLMSSVMGVSASEAARMVIEGTMNNIKGKEEDSG